MGTALTRGLGVVALTLAASTGVAQAAIRYAAPSAHGSGDCSSAANACTLQQAVSGSAQGDTVIVAGNEGTYGAPLTPLTSPISDPANDAPGTIEGAPGQRRPVIYTNANVGFNFSGVATVNGQMVATSVSNLDIEELGLGLPTALEVNGNVDHVLVRSVNAAFQACELFGLPAPQTEVISDSLCFARNGAALGTSSTGTLSPESITLRNDTVYASGVNAAGLDFSIGQFTLNVSATNVIAHGDTRDVEATEFNGGRVGVVLDHSNYSTVLATGGASVTSPGSGSNQKTAPRFVNAAADNFHEEKGSPTIDAGIKHPANGATDLDGHPRTIGRSTDIGAYEAADAPTIVFAGPSGVGIKRAKLVVSVNPNFSPTTVVAYVGKTIASETPLPVHSAGSGITPVTLSFAAAGLSPGTRYHFQFVAANSIGRTLSAGQTFVTLRGGKIAFASRKAAVHGSKARVRLRCSANGPGCRGALVLQGAKARFAISAGQTATVAVKLTQPTLSALMGSPHHRLDVLATITRSDGGAIPRATTITLTLS